MECHCLTAFTSGDMADTSLVILFPVYDVINSEVNLSFLIKLFSYVTKSFRTKTQISQNEKGLLTFNYEIKSNVHRF